MMYQGGNNVSRCLLVIGWSGLFLHCISLSDPNQSDMCLDPIDFYLSLNPGPSLTQRPVTFTTGVCLYDVTPPLIYKDVLCGRVSQGCSQPTTHAVSEVFPIASTALAGYVNPWPGQ